MIVGAVEGFKAPSREPIRPTAEMGRNREPKWSPQIVVWIAGLAGQQNLEVHQIRLGGAGRDQVTDRLQEGE